MVNQNLTEVLLSKKIVAVIPFSTSGDFCINEKLQLKNLITQKNEEIGNKFYVCPGYTLS